MPARGSRLTKYEMGERIERVVEILVENPRARQYKLCSLVMKLFPEIDRTTAWRYVHRAREAIARSRTQRLREIGDVLIDTYLAAAERCKEVGEFGDEIRAYDGVARLVTAAGPAQADDTTPDVIEFVTRTPGAASDAQHGDN